ncbi:hypothetical protein [Streptomyces sp. Inha503]|uniref:hypothetical protein n=1 Tax=Streptomyces sp. Inha503 TaxID=3383314 RepID=UPI0039A017EA
MTDVVLFEAADRLGGQLSTAALAPHRTGWAALLGFYERGLYAARVDVRLGQTAEPGAELEGLDAVVLATGAVETSPLLDVGAMASSVALARGVLGPEGVTVAHRISGGTCPCRKSHPCSSRCMLIFVEDAAEAIVPAYVEAG